MCTQDVFDATRMMFILHCLAVATQLFSFSGKNILNWARWHTWGGFLHRIICKYDPFLGNVTLRPSQSVWKMAQPRTCVTLLHLVSWFVWLECAFYSKHFHGIYFSVTDISPITIESFCVILFEIIYLKLPKFLKYNT